MSTLKSGLHIEVSIKDTELFYDIVELLESVAEKDESIMLRLTEIMSKHSTEYYYSINSNG